MVAAIRIKMLSGCRSQPGVVAISRCLNYHDSIFRRHSHLGHEINDSEPFLFTSAVE